MFFLQDSTDPKSNGDGSLSKKSLKRPAQTQSLIQHRPIIRVIGPAVQGSSKDVSPLKKCKTDPVTVQPLKSRLIRTNPLTFDMQEKLDNSKCADVASATNDQIILRTYKNVLKLREEVCTLSSQLKSLGMQNTNQDHTFPFNLPLSNEEDVEKCEAFIKESNDNVQVLVSKLRTL